MSDRVTISNVTLGAIGCSVRITDPNDSTKEAAELRAAWDESRRATLRSGPKWNFAMRRAAIPALGSDTAPADEIYPFARAFALPGGSLRLVDLLDASENDKYRVERGWILTDLAAPLRISHIVDVEDCTLWDASFIDAFTQYLGFKVALNLTGDRSIKLDCWSAWQSLTSGAAGVDAVENPPEEHPESSWITSRFAC